ncbi:MAG: amidohydrolase, partial [Pseudomonadota bacterium]
MHKPLIALAAALLATAANAATLIDNVNGIGVDDQGRIFRFSGLLVGDDGKVERLVRADEPKPAATQKVDGGGRTLLPGLIDSHGHVAGLGRTATTLDLVGTSSLAELQQRLKDYAAAHPGDGWIIGRGWNQELWPVKSFPFAADLDSIVANRPVVLERVDGHALVANSAALRAAGVTAATPVPSGGQIDRGLFVDNAMNLIGAKIPGATPDERDQWLAAAQTMLLGYGITATADMGTDPGDWAAMRRAGEAGTLKLRIISYGSGLDGAKEISPAGPTQWLYADHLRMNGVKLYDDGALGSRGAWLKAPYADKPGSIGLPFHSDSQFDALIAEAAARHYQIASHAIGDAGNAQVINAYVKYGAASGDKRWRIEHAQIVDPKDLPRIGANHIIASMQPTHQTSDRLMAEARLGPNRLDGAYAWASMLRTGARLAFGSDYPVESPNPFPGLAAAISRQDLAGQPPGGWRPEEKVSFAQALDAFTRGGAYAGFAEGKFGALAPGHWADFIIVDRDPTAIDAQALARTKVLETWI